MLTHTAEGPVDSVFMFCVLLLTTHQFFKQGILIHDLFTYGLDHHIDDLA